MTSTKLIFIFHLLTSLIMTLFEIYFIYNIFAKYINIVTSPYAIGLILGVLFLTVTYLLVLRRVSTFASFLPSIAGIIILIVVALLYIWKTQSIDGSGYFFVCVFLAPFVTLSAIWSLLSWLVAKIIEASQHTQIVKTREKRGD